MARSLEGVGYLQDMRSVENLPFNAQGSSASINSSCYNNGPILRDEWQCEYLLIGKNDMGEWRRYIVDGAYEEPSFWTRPSLGFPAPAFDANHSKQQQGPSQEHKSFASSANKGSSGQRTEAAPDRGVARVDFAVAPSSKRNTNPKPKNKAKRSALEEPLSEMTKHLTHIPIKDVETWVKRSAEDRQKQTRSDGTIKRPSNSFMLYRSAYADRCREIEKSKNHQDISAIAGASWKIETQDVKAQFEGWAKIERENHHKAFPNYKFQPQTQAAKDRKRKQRNDGLSEVASDEEDPTRQISRTETQAQTKPTRPKTQRMTYREYSNSPSFQSSDEVNTPESFLPFDHPSSYFPNIDSGKPMPTAIEHTVHPSDYYITSHPTQTEHEDMAPFADPVNSGRAVYYPVDPQVMQCPSPSPPVGLPGISHGDLIGDLAIEGGQMMLSGMSMLDPGFGGPQQILERMIEGDDHLPQSQGIRSIDFRSVDYLKDSENPPYLSRFFPDDVL